MANPDHVALLRQGVSVWNSWRDSNPNIIPDLSGIHIPFNVEITGTLEGANFRQANFIGITGLGPDRDWSGRIPSMDDADFTGANLAGAYFWRADFNGASFRNAILDGAEFEQVSLERTQTVGT